MLILIFIIIKPTKNNPHTKIKEFLIKKKYDDNDLYDEILFKNIYKKKNQILLIP